MGRDFLIRDVRARYIRLHLVYLQLRLPTSYVNLSDGVS